MAPRLNFRHFPHSSAGHQGIWRYRVFYLTGQSGCGRSISSTSVLNFNTNYCKWSKCSSSFWLNQRRQSTAANVALNESAAPATVSAPLGPSNLLLSPILTSSVRVETFLPISNSFQPQTQTGDNLSPRRIELEQYNNSDSSTYARSNDAFAALGKENRSQPVSNSVTETALTCSGLSRDVVDIDWCSKNQHLFPFPVANPLPRRNLNMKRILKFAKWDITTHGTFDSLVCSLRVAFHLQCIKHHYDIRPVLDMLKKVRMLAYEGLQDKNLEYFAQDDPQLVNQFLFAFASRKVESFSESIDGVDRIMFFLHHLSTKTMVDVSTVYGLLLILVRHKQVMTTKLETNEKEKKLLAALTKAIQSQVRHLVELHNVDLNQFLTGRLGRYLSLREKDEDVLAELAKIFPNVVPEREQQLRLPKGSYSETLLAQVAERDPNQSCCLRLPAAVDLQNQCVDQKRIEDAQFVELQSVLQENEASAAPNLLDYLIHCWEISIRKGFDMLVEELNKAEDMPSVLLRPFYTILDPVTYVKLILNKLMYMVTDEIPQSINRNTTFTENHLVNDLKTAISQLVIERCSGDEQIMKIYQKYVKYLTSNDPSQSRGLNHRELWHKCSMEVCGEPFKLKDDAEVLLHWPPGLFLLVGDPLVELILDSALIFQDIGAAQELFSAGDFEALGRLSKLPALTLEVRVSNGLQTTYTVVRSRALVVLLEQNMSSKKTLSYGSGTLPMIVPPVPRLDPFFGGNLNKNFVHLIRKAKDHSRSCDRLMSKWPHSFLSPFFDSLNVISSVPWKVNERVFETVLDIFQKGSTVPNLDIPLPKEHWPELDKDFLGSGFRRRKKQEKHKMSVEEVKLATQKARHDLMVHQQLAMKQTGLLKKLTLVNWLRHKLFWFPTNADFRGRMYPVSVWISHIGPDLDRGLLLFAEGQPLGGKQTDCSGKFELDGLDWLKIHLANLQGSLKSHSLYERLKFTNDYLDCVLKSAENPVDFGWWQHFEEPWQALATCFEINEAIKSGKPETYVCHLPVHQDGSCNGLQHYAALGRDEEAAVAVNVVDGGRPGDVYSRIADLVENKRQEDATKGLLIAKACEGLIDRSTCKQPVMTTVYGVSAYGAKTQIYKKLKRKSRDGLLRQDLNLFEAARYISQVIMHSFGNLFYNSSKIQHWLVDVANCVSRDVLMPMQWVTPLGFPVVQPYYDWRLDDGAYDERDDRLALDPELALMARYKRKNVVRQVPLAMRQSNSVAPNFIHSLDSTHMQLTALHCDRQRIAFVSVHDCFWTHPSNVNEMNKICREQFFMLHNEDLLGMITAFLKGLVSNELTPNSELLRRREEQSQLALAQTESSLLPCNQILKRSKDRSSWQHEAKYLRDLLDNKRPEKGTLNLEDVKKTVYFFS